MAHKFEGKIVRLKTGSTTNMAVQSVLYNSARGTWSDAVCKWVDASGVPHEERFNTETLELANEGDESMDSVTI